MGPLNCCDQKKSGAKLPSSSFCFNSSTEIICLIAMRYIRFPLSMRNMEDLMFERGINIRHKTGRLW